jgi:GNAT superfamily N-acetyltransferase
MDIKQVDVKSKSQVNEFVKFPFRLYRKCPQWVPPFIGDIKVMMNPDKHPYYEHSDAEFFTVSNGNEMLGRIALMENKPFNEYHDAHKAQFYLFDCVDDQEAANTLFEFAFEWCKGRGLDELVGPKGFSPFDGYGIQIEGYEHRQMMIMMNYNYPYYAKLVENLGFVKEVDFVSDYLNMKNFNIPDRIHEIARRVQERGRFKVKRFKNKRELSDWAWRIGQAYNKAFVNNWEYYPLTDREIKFQLDNILIVAVPKLMKIITYDDEVVGFLLAFPDISAALQRNKGRITPWGIVDILTVLHRTKFISLNGVGVLQEYQGRGANALLYSEIHKTITESGYTEAELTQVANTAVQMRKDLRTVGGIEYKNHRVYKKTI